MVSVDADFLTPKASVRADATGWGSHAIEAIAAGETVAAFGGRCVSRTSLDQLSPNERIRAIQIDDDLFLVAGNANTAAGDTINHSCQPNCGMNGGVLLVAMRDIEPGEALTYDYAMSNGSDFNEFECGCRTPSCRHKVTGNDWMLPELQLAYRGHFSPYLAKRIARLVAIGAERRAFAL